MIENPEAHLHPSGQSRIGEMLALTASSGVQVITETHSDHVLNGIRLAAKSGKIDPSNVELHFFERGFDRESNETRIITPKMDKNGRLDRWPKGFFDEWDKSVDGLLD
jgi:predicted ATPase